MSGTQGDGVNTQLNAAGRPPSSLNDENSRRKVQNVRARSRAGHQDLSTTQRYMHLSPAALDAAIRLLDGAGETQPFHGLPGRGDIGEAAGVEWMDLKPLAYNKLHILAAEIHTPRSTPILVVMHSTARNVVDCF